MRSASLARSMPASPTMGSCGGNALMRSSDPVRRFCAARCIGVKSLAAFIESRRSCSAASMANSLPADRVTRHP